MDYRERDRAAALRAVRDVARRHQRVIPLRPFVLAALVCIGVAALSGYRIGHTELEDTGAAAAAVGRSLCASVRHALQVDHDDLVDDDDSLRVRAADSLLGARVPDAAELVELCTPIAYPTRARVTDCRARRDFACLAAIAGELELELARYTDDGSAP